MRNSLELLKAITGLLGLLTVLFLLVTGAVKLFLAFTPVTMVLLVAVWMIEDSSESKTK